ncbi:MAG: ABC transporter permease [Clostridiales bacterium]|nr:ABC transporter permease [Clostridiales bacterium]
MSHKFDGARLHLSSPRDFFSNYALVLVLVGLFIFFAVSSPYFLNPQNFINMFIAVSVVGIMSTAQTICLIGRGLDISVGSIAAMMGCIQANLVLVNGMPWFVGILVSIGVGLLVGFVNGIIIVKFNLNPFIVTLGMMNVVRGLAFVMVDGMAHFVSDSNLTFLGSARLGAIPVSIVILALSFVVIHFISTKTVFGRNIYASGGNVKAARLAGINTSKVAIILFTISGFMAAIAGIVAVGIGGTAMPSMGEHFALDTITAVLLGGTSLAGGSGSVPRTALGMVIIGIINNGMALLNVQTFWQITAKGALLLGAIMLDASRNK